MNSGETELFGAILQVVRAFDELGVDYLIGGSVASTVFGEPRQTIDADVIARLLPAHAEPLVRMLQEDCYIDVGEVSAAIRDQKSFNIIHLATMTKVDVFVRWRSAFAQSQLARRQKKIIGAELPIQLFFASAEDTILAKLEWFRNGGETSDRQWRDVLGVLKVQRDKLDRAYLEHWAKELGLADLLARAENDAGM